MSATEDDERMQQLRLSATDGEQESCTLTKKDKRRPTLDCRERRCFLTAHRI